MNERRDVFVVGDFAPGDPGRESLLTAVLRALDGFSVAVTSSDPARTAAGRECGVTDLIDRRAVASRALTAGALVFAGGRLTGSGRGGIGGPGGLAAAVTLATVASAAGKPVALLGVAVDPPSTRAARLLSRRLVRLADLLILRDRQSALALALAGAPTPFRVGADPVWAELDRSLGPVVRDATLATVAIRDGSRATDLLCAALSSLPSPELRVRLVPWRSPPRSSEDMDLAYRVATRLPCPTEILPPPRDLPEAREMIAGSGVLVAMSEDAVTVAESVSVPVVSIGVPTVAFGPQHALVGSSFGPNADPHELARSIAYLVAAPPPTTAVIRERSAAAEEGFRLLRLILRGGMTDEANLGGGLALEPVTWR